MTQDVLVVIARWLVAALFLASGVQKLLDLPGTRALMARYRLPLVPAALAAALATEFGGGVLLGLGLFGPIPAALLIVYVVSASVMIPVRQLAEPENRKGAVMTLVNNVAVVGALLRLAADAL